MKTYGGYMSKIGIFSDSHEHIEYIRKALSLFKKENVDAIIHCGDLISPIMSRIFNDLGIPAYFVYGNNDGERLFLEKTLRKAGVNTFVGPSSINILDKKILFMHEPVEINSLFEHGSFDLICYGHTHKIDILEKEGKFLVNPGETCGLLTGKKTVAIVDFDKGVDIIEL